MMKIFMLLLFTIQIGCSKDHLLSNGVKPFIKNKLQAKPFGALSPCFGTIPKLDDFNNHQLFNYDMTEVSKWMHPLSDNQEDVKGVILLAHGLNLRPSKMNSLGHTFSRHGFYSLRVSLAGHRGNLNEMKLVTRKSLVV